MNDRRSLADSFLTYTNGLNDLPAVSDRALLWVASDNGLGEFDIVVDRVICNENDLEPLCRGVLG